MSSLHFLRGCVFIVLMGCQAIGMTQDLNSSMSQTAKAAQNMQNPLYPKIRLPLSYNYNQKLGANSSEQQNQLQFNPVIPIELKTDLQLILNPMLTMNRNIENQQISNQDQPLQLATYLTPRFAKEWFFGLGPYMQLPASNAKNGTRQYGLGLSASAFYRPDHWVVGGTVFNSWGVGSDLAGGTADILNVQPAVSYTTDNAITYSLSSQLSFNHTSRTASNQLTLTGGKAISVLGYPLQFQIGPTYMITSNQTSAKGIGAYMSFTAMIDK
jgi:hypothetical protein